MAELDVSRLRAFIGGDAAEDGDVVLEGCLTEAKALVDEYVTENRLSADPVDAPPEAILHRAYLEVGADLWNRRNAPNGVITTQYQTEYGLAATPIRIGRDPMAPAYPLLAQWVLPIGFA